MQLLNFGFLDRFEDALVILLTHQIFLAPILLLTIEEAGFPLPIADFTIAYTGYQVSLGHISFLTAFIMLLIADLLGASILYFLCSRYGPHIIEKFGKYIHLDQHKLNLVEEKFRKYGSFFIIFGRHIPGFRIPITVFSGISEMTYVAFIISTFISIVWWIPFYLIVGQRLGSRTIQLLHANGWFALFFFLPLVFSIAPFFFLRKKTKNS
jgi:membrane protein DedA with SNARE-associated domain